MRHWVRCSTKVVRRHTFDVAQTVCTWLKKDSLRAGSYTFARNFGWRSTDCRCMKHTNVFYIEFGRFREGEQRRLSTPSASNSFDDKGQCRDWFALLLQALQRCVFVGRPQALRLAWGPSAATLEVTTEKTIFSAVAGSAAGNRSINDVCRGDGDKEEKQNGNDESENQR